MSKNRSRPCVVDELELTPTFDKEPFLYPDAFFCNLVQDYRQHHGHHIAYGHAYGAVEGAYVGNLPGHPQDEELEAEPDQGFGDHVDHGTENGRQGCGPEPGSVIGLPVQMAQVLSGPGGGPAQEELGQEGGGRGGGVSGQQICQGQADGPGKGSVFCSQHQGGQQDEGVAYVDFPGEPQAHGDFDPEIGKAGEGQSGEHPCQGQFFDLLFLHGYQLLTALY